MTRPTNYMFTVCLLLFDRGCTYLLAGVRVGHARTISPFCPDIQHSDNNNTRSYIRATLPTYTAMALTSSSATPNPTSSAVPVPSSHPVVEARSLSSITTIAANPPAYPRNPTAKKLDPLVLYIVKVPGSKGTNYYPLRIAFVLLRLCSS